MSKTVRLLLRSKTSLARAGEIYRVINDIYPARLDGDRGKYEVRFNVAEDDTKHIWLLLLIKDAKDIKPGKATNTKGQR